MSDSPLSQDEALNIVKMNLGSDNNDPIEFIPVNPTEVHAYNFDPEGWVVFCMTDGFRIGAAPHYAVHQKTKEGILGE